RHLQPSPLLHGSSQPMQYQNSTSTEVRAHVIRAMRALTVILSQDALTLESLTRSDAEGLLAGLMPRGGAREANCARPLPEQEVPLPRAVPCPPGTALLRVARLYHGSVTEGPGRRSVVAVQGCPLRCRGCYVPETHDPRGGVALPEIGRAHV